MAFTFFAIFVFFSKFKKKSNILELSLLVYIFEIFTFVYSKRSKTESIDSC